MATVLERDTGRTSTCRTSTRIHMVWSNQTVGRSSETDSIGQRHQCDTSSMGRCEQVNKLQLAFQTCWQRAKGQDQRRTTCTWIVQCDATVGINKSSAMIADDTWIGKWRTWSSMTSSTFLERTSMPKVNGIGALKCRAKPEQQNMVMWQDDWTETCTHT